MVLAGSKESMNAEAAGKWLRAAMSQKRTSCKSLEEILDFLGPLSESVAKEAVCWGNSNGKAPIHFASQHMGDKDGSILVETLIKSRANVNHATRRGHTPLIFAAGRGHNDIVQRLLLLGADPRVTVVTGDTALSMGRTRLDADTIAQLEAAEAGAASTWQDFQNLADAHVAQSEHVMTCPHCRKKMLQKEAEAEVIRIDAMAVELSARLETVLTFSTTEARIALPEMVTPVALTSNDRAALEPALRSAFHRTILADKAALRKVLEICQEHELLAVFEAAGCRDLRAVRPILAALIAELKSSVGLVEAAAAEHIFQSADPLLALEISLLKSNLEVNADAAVIEAFWQTRLANQMSQLSASSLMPALWPASSKKEGGPVVAVLLRVIQWICHVKGLTATWGEMIDTLAAEATRLKKVQSLRQALISHEAVLVIPQVVLERLVDVTKTTDVQIPDSSTFLKRRIVQEVESAGSKTSLSPYRSACTTSWICGDVALTGLKQHLEGVILQAPPQKRIQVGIDTEWGDNANSDGPCIVQLAHGESAWVIDTSHPSPIAKSFFRWLFGQDCVQFLGFAFAHDVEKLGNMLHEQGSQCQCVPHHIVDLQKVAMVGEASRAHTPGLKHVVATWLALDLDKSQQCSDWDKRPLSASQLTYAAADAAVLLDLAGAMGV